MSGIEVFQDMALPRRPVSAQRSEPGLAKALALAVYREVAVDATIYGGAPGRLPLRVLRRAPSTLPDCLRWTDLRCSCRNG